MSLHENYFNKVGHFSLDRRMENLPTSETLISSLQRQLGLTNNSSESEVWSTSDLYESIFDAKRKDQIAKIFRSEFSSPMSKKVLADKQNSSSTHIFREYVKPIIPVIAGNVHSARSGSGKGSPWNPGRWLLEELTFAFDDLEEYKLFVFKLAEAFKVSDQDNHELALYIRNSTKYFTIEINEKVIDESWSNNKKRNQFGWGASQLHQNYVSLINYVLDLKNEYSRYRLFLFLDAVLRLFATISTLWRFKQTNQFISCLEESKIYDGFLSLTHVVNYGESRTKIVKFGIQDYMINYLQIYHICNALKIDATTKLTSELFNHISSNITTEIIRENKVKALRTIHEHKSEFYLKESTLKNSKEFLEYVGIQKPDFSFKTMDYTYHYEKSGGEYKFAFGDALLVILVKYVGGIKSNEFTSIDFVESLNVLGVKIDYSEFSMGTLGKALVRLGLVEELSDSDSGMIFRAV